MNDAGTVANSNMTNIAYFKYVLLGLLLISTTTVVFYVSSVSQMETEQAHTSQPLVFREVFQRDAGHIVLTRMIDIERQKLLQETCQQQETLQNENSRRAQDNLELLEHIIVDETHKLLYCYVPKVACTNWKRVFMILLQKTNITNVVDISASLAHSQGMFMKLGNYSNDDISNILQTYTKFIFVRHPFERLLSAYRNKLEQHYESSKYFQHRFGRNIIKRYRPNASQVALMKGDDVSFKEFSAYLTDRENTVFNEHWKPIHELCMPCLVNYDIIGKYETLQDDAEFVLRHTGQSQIQFPRLPKPSSTMSHLKHYFSTLSNETIHQLYKIYELDFKLFGYDIQDIFHPDPT